MSDNVRHNKPARPSPFFAALLLAALAAILVFACTGSRRTAQTQATATELRYGYATEPPVLDPLSASRTADGAAIFFNIYEGLVRPDTEGRIQPCLAETVTVEGAGRVYRFKLREGVLFHNGLPLTSHDVKVSLDTAIAAGLPGLEAIASVETDGDFGVLVNLKQPDTEFLPYLTVGIVSAAAMNTGRWAIGTGPYYIESYNVQQSLELKKFDDYWRDGVPRLEKITVLFLADSDALLLGLQAGSIDGAGITGPLAYQIKADSFDIVPGYSSMVQLLALNNAAPPLNDIRVRQAINYGIDIQGIIDAAFYGWGEPSGSPIIPGLSAYYEQSLADPYPVDISKAISLLAEAGYGEGRQRLSLEITVPSNYTMHVDTAQVIADQLAKIGIDVSIQLVDWGTWLNNVYQGRNYQATIISLDSPVVSPRSFLLRYQSGNGSNFINFASADFDRVFQAILAETDEDRRVALYKQAQRILSDEAASVYIQDILLFRALRAGAFGGVLNYPLSADDFASMYGK
jgi:peptide/nickel transport system substrate-binding protein